MGIADGGSSLAAMQLTLTMTASAGSRRDTEVISPASTYQHSLSEPAKQLRQSLCAMLPVGF